MKDIYEMLNDIDIDLQELPATDVDDLEKLRVKKMVRRELKGKVTTMNKRGRSAIAAAVAVLVFAGAGGASMAFPAYAKEVPVVGDIFRFLDQGKTGVYDLYESSALNIDMTRESKGIEITLNQGVYDGRTLSLTYTIKTEKDFGEFPFMKDDLVVRGIDGYTGGSQIEKVSPGVYVGHNSYTLFAENNQNHFENFKFDWTVKGLCNIETDGEPEEVKLRMGYNVALEQLSNTSVKIQADKETLQGVTLQMDSLSATPINTMLYLTQETTEELARGVEIDWIIKDDLGTVYEFIDNGSSGRIEGDRITSQKIVTFGKLSDQAQKLYVTPILKLVHTSGGGISLDEEGNEERFSYEGLPEGVSPGEWKMKEITIDLSSLK